MDIRWFDCNCSIGRSARPPLRYAATGAELLAEMDFCGIDRALVHHSNQRFSSAAGWNERLADELSGDERLEPV